MSREIILDEETKAIIKDRPEKDSEILIVQAGDGIWLSGKQIIELAKALQEQAECSK